jgi:hypothetical protein
MSDAFDLDSNLGEGFGVWRMGDDFDLLGVVSSASVACGFGARSPSITQRVVWTGRCPGATVRGCAYRPARCHRRPLLGHPSPAGTRRLADPWPH